VTQGIVQDKVSAALTGALLLARQKGLLKVEQLPPVHLEAPKRPVQETSPHSGRFGASGGSEAARVGRCFLHGRDVALCLGA